jgi:hypothetical protein
MQETETTRLTPPEVKILVMVQSIVKGGAMQCAWSASLKSCALPLRSRIGTA